MKNPLYYSQSEPAIKFPLLDLPLSWVHAQDRSICNNLIAFKQIYQRHTFLSILTFLFRWNWIKLVRAWPKTKLSAFRQLKLVHYSTSFTKATTQINNTCSSRTEEDVRTILALSVRSYTLQQVFHMNASNAQEVDKGIQKCFDDLHASETGLSVCVEFI